MRILVLSHMFPNGQNPQLGIFVLEQMRALRKCGVELVTIVPIPWIPRTLNWMKRGRQFWAMPLQTTVDGFKVYHPRVLELPSGKGFSLYGLSYYLGIRSVVRELVRDLGISLIHVHTLMPDGFAGVLLARECGIPAVCTAHGSDVNIYPHRSMFTLWATRWALRRIDRLIVVSQVLREKVLALVGEMSVEVAHNGADPDVFANVPKLEARAKLGLGNREKIILFVGNMIPVKGAEYLLRAFAQVKASGADVRLFLVGEGILRGNLEALTTMLGVQDSVCFCGRRPHDEIPLWLSAADCLAIPSLSEGFPTLIPEAMMCRVPIVATNAGGIPEILSNERTGLMIAIGDVEGLARGIARALRHDQDVESMVKEAERTARGGYSWEMNARKTLQVYREAVEGYEA